jgi:hypothetical protein
MIFAPVLAFFLLLASFASCSRLALSEALVAVSFHAESSAARLKRKNEKVNRYYRYAQGVELGFVFSSFSIMRKVVDY